MIRIELENGKNIDLELYPDKAPKTCENFVKLVNDGFYDGLGFHRIISGFMIQGGCPLGTGGIARKIVACCKHKVHYEPDLLLDGLYRFYKLNQKEEA